MRKVLFSFFSIFLGFNSIFAGWTAPNYIVASQNADNPEYVLPAIAFNQSGYTVTAWTYIDTSFLPSRANIQASISTDFGKSWPTPISYIDQANYQSQLANMFVRLAVNDNNDALMVWHRYDPTLIPAGYDVRVCSLTNTPIGPTAQNLTVLDANAGAQGGGLAPRPKIVMVDNTAIVAWDHESGGSHDIYYAITPDSGATWPITGSIPMGALAPNVDPVFPELYFDSTGLAIVIFQYTSDGSNYYVCQSTSTDSGNTWSNASIISSSTPDWVMPALDGDNNGNAVAIWQFETGPWPAPFDIQSSAYVSGSGWQPVQTIDTAIYDWNTPRVTMNNNSEVIATYQMVDPTQTNYWVKTAFSSNGGQTWDIPVFVDPLNPDTNWNTHSEVAMDDYGVVLCVWNSHLGGNNWTIKGAVSNDFGSTWSTTVLSPLATNKTAYCPRVKVGVLDTGNHHAVNGFAIWAHIDSITPYSVIEANHFQAITLKATGEHHEIKDYLQEALQNVITAEAIGQNGTFRLYKDAALTQLIGTVTHSHRVAKFIENNVSKGETFTYYVTWTDEFNKGVVGPIAVRFED